MIIDCHTHLNHYGPTPPESLAHRIGCLEEAMVRNGVDYALVLSSYRVDGHRPSTQDIVAAIGTRTNIGIVAGVSLMENTIRQVAELSQLLAAGRIKGLKIYPGYEPFHPHDARYRFVYELASEFDVPVMIHSGDTFAPSVKVKYAHPLEIDEVAVDFPSVKFVICHLGNPWFRDCMEIVYKNKNVYADLSGLMLGEFPTRFEQYLRRQVDEFLMYAGEPRWLLFGTDWPICSMEAYVKFMRGLRLGAADKDRILFENAAALFRIQLPQAPPVDPVAPRTAEPRPRRLRARALRPKGLEDAGL